MKFGRYEIKRPLGQGGTATVYLAYDPHFEREVAVKVLPSGLLEDTTLRQRFQREARAIAQLEHSAIVPVHDFGEENGQPYLVMRFMRGGSLHERIAYSSLTLAEVTTILTRIANALTAAHQRGLVHRDIKPSNILFDEHDEPYLADFGIAKWLEGQAQLTQDRPIGTPAYMSPEQIRPNGKADTRSDVYALTTVLFQMLTGEPPYQAETTRQLFMAHLTQPIPDLHAIDPSLPKLLSTVVQRGMAKESAERYQTATELAVATSHVIQSSQVLEQIPSPKRARHWLWAAGIASLLLISVIFWQLRPTVAPGATQFAEIDGMVQNFIPAGEFRVGVTEAQISALCEAQNHVGDSGGDRCDPLAYPHTVPRQTMATEAFWLDQTEVSNAQYRLCVEAGACSIPNETDRYPFAAYSTHPVTSVTWQQSRDYCVWAGRDLPTAAQWYKAAYGKGQTLFAWGDDFSCEKANVANCTDETSPVGSYTGMGSSAYGIEDMTGNVSEWVREDYSASLMEIWEMPLNLGIGELANPRAITGGAFDSGLNNAIPFFSVAYLDSFDDVGFRCVSAD